MRLVEKLRLLRILTPIAFWLLIALTIAAMHYAPLAAVITAPMIWLGLLLVRARLEGPARRALAAPGHGPCPTCGYPATDRPDGPCPECGDPTARSQIRSVWDQRLGYWWTGVPF